MLAISSSIVLTSCPCRNSFNFAFDMGFLDDSHFDSTGALIQGRRRASIFPGSIGLLRTERGSLLGTQGCRLRGLVQNGFPCDAWAAQNGMCWHNLGCICTARPHAKDQLLKASKGGGVKFKGMMDFFGYDTDMTHIYFWSYGSLEELHNRYDVICCWRFQLCFIMGLHFIFSLLMGKDHWGLFSFQLAAIGGAFQVLWYSFSSVEVNVRVCYILDHLYAFLM